MVNDLLSLPASTSKSATILSSLYNSCISSVSFLFFYRVGHRARHSCLLVQCHVVYHIDRDGYNLLPISFIGLCFCIVRMGFHDSYKLYAELIYIANQHYKMNDLRRRQIENILDYDENINAMVMNVEKNNVELTTESLLPYTQLNTEANESVSTAINQLFV